MPGRSLRIARIAGIPVGVSVWWLLIVALLTLSLGLDYFPARAPGLAPAACGVLALASVLLLFAGILAHEFAHALVARRAGVEIEEIDLWLLGGVARMRNQPTHALDELRFALAGPALTAVLALVFGLVAWGLPASAPAALEAFVAYQFQVNVAIALFNLVPALPLDGGRAARAFIWWRSGDLRRATVIAARGGRWIGYALIWFGVLAVLAGIAAGIWMGVIGIFLVAAASAEQQRVELEAVLAGLAAADLMSAPAVTLRGTLAVPDARDAARRHGYTAFPVVDEDGAVLGLLATSRLVPALGDATAGELADPDPALVLGRDEPAAQLLERPAFLAFGRAVVVDAERRPLGIVSMTDMQRRLRGSRFGARPRRPARMMR